MRKSDAEILAMDNAEWIDWMPSDGSWSTGDGATTTVLTEGVLKRAMRAVEDAPMRPAIEMGTPVGCCPHFVDPPGPHVAFSRVRDRKVVRVCIHCGVDVDAA